MLFNLPMNSPMYSSRSDLPIGVRQGMIVRLQKRLADELDLVYQLKQAHWNVRGPTFIALHKLFDELHEKAERCADLIAERISQFGGTAEGTLQTVQKNTSLPIYETSLTGEVAHLQAVANAYAV